MGAGPASIASRNQDEGDTRLVSWQTPSWELLEATHSLDTARPTGIFSACWTFMSAQRVTPCPYSYLSPENSTSLIN